METNATGLLIEITEQIAGTAVFSLTNELVFSWRHRHSRHHFPPAVGFWIASVHRFGFPPYRPQALSHIPRYQAVLRIGLMT